MSPQQNVFGLIDSRREVGRAAVIGMKLLHEGPMGPRDLLTGRALRKTKDLMSLIFRHGTWSPAASMRRTGAPVVSSVLCCLTPAGKPAVEISFKQPRAFGVVAQAALV